MKNDSRPLQLETNSSIEGTDDNSNEIEIEKTILPGHVKHKVATEQTNIEESTPQNVQNKIPIFGLAKFRVEASVLLPAKKSVKVSVNLEQV